MMVGDIFGGLGGLGGLEDILKSPTQRAQDAMKRADEKVKADASKNAPLPQIRGKRNPEGVWYLRAEDVLAALEKTGQKDSPLARKIRNLLRR